MDNKKDKNCNQPVRKIRMSCTDSDQDATDSSGDDDQDYANGSVKSVKRVVKEIYRPNTFTHYCKNGKKKGQDSSSSFKVTPSVKFGVEIRDPDTGKIIWLGTLKTAEQGNEAYVAMVAEFEKRKKKNNNSAEKKPEFDRKMTLPNKKRNSTGLDSHPSPSPVLDVPKSKPILDGPSTSSSNPIQETISASMHCGNENFIEKNEEKKAQESSSLFKENGVRHQRFSPLTMYPGVRRRHGRYCAEIRDPFIGKKVWLGCFETAEEAYEVFLAKKAAFVKKKNYDYAKKILSNKTRNLNGLDSHLSSSSVIDVPNSRPILDGPSTSSNNPLRETYSRSMRVADGLESLGVGDNFEQPISRLFEVPSLSPSICQELRLGVEENLAYGYNDLKQSSECLDGMGIDMVEFALDLKYTEEEFACSDGILCSEENLAYGDDDLLNVRMMI